MDNLYDREYTDTLVGDHWKYVQATLDIHGVSESDMSIARYHYLTAFAHGYKHGVEDTMERMRSDEAGELPDDFQGWTPIEKNGQIAMAKVINGRWQIADVGTHWSDAKAMVAIQIALREYYNKVIKPSQEPITQP